LLKARFEARTRRDLAVAGFFLALAATADIPTSIFYVVFFLYLVRDPKLRKNCGFYLLPLSLTVLPALAMTYSIHHSVLPVQIFRSYFEYYGSPWIGSSELSGMGTNDAPFFVRYALLTLFGPKGFLIYNPFLAVALWGLAREIRKKEAFYHEGIAVAGASIALALYYWLTTNNYGGSSYSIRWFVPLIPVLLFFLYPFLEDFNGRRAMQFRALLGVSILIAFVGAINPWSQVIYSEAPFIANIKQVAQRLHGPSTTSSVP
jgi:hypothetical protein